MRKTTIDLLAVLLMFIALCVTGCNVLPKDQAPIHRATDQRLTVTSYDGLWRIVTDKQTGVQYLDCGEAAVVMVDKEGKPLINKESEETTWVKH